MSGTPESPVAVIHERSCWLLRSDRSPGDARRLLEELLVEVPDGQCFAEAGLLIVSELVTNAVLHGTPGGNRVRLVMSVCASWLRIEVHDARADREPVLRAGGSDDESGRGLFLVKSLSRRWGCGPRPGVGKIVWAEVGPEGWGAA
ncbi:ATP-binding protein [Kitasatospora sp. NPDC005751]|uniref:ATP-binding protein n=1 Tax=unclassified Kitasatospora TaxID=2633591 RepID=UPI0033C177E3